MLERGVVAGDAVELLGALVRGNGDERATGAGGVVRELAGQAAQAREAGTADALGEGREEEDRVCVATHDCASELSLQTHPSSAGQAAPRATGDTGRRPGATPPARSSNAPLRVQIWLSPECTSLGLGQKREIAKRELQMCSRSAAAAAALSPRRGDLDEVGGSHGRPELRRTEGLATTRNQRPRHIARQAARIAPTRAAVQRAEARYVDAKSQTQLLLRPAIATTR